PPIPLAPTPSLPVALPISGAAASDQAVGSTSAIKCEEVRPAGARDNLDDPSSRVRVAICVLGREPFVVVGVAVYDEIRIGVIKVCPERLDTGVRRDGRR